MTLMVWFLILTNHPCDINRIYNRKLKIYSFFTFEKGEMETSYDEARCVSVSQSR